MQEEEYQVVFGRLLDIPPVLLFLFTDQNLVTWTHPIAWRLGNVLFILSSCDPCYKIEVLGLEEVMELSLSKGLLIKAVEIKNRMG